MRHSAKDTSSTMVKNVDPAVLLEEESFSWLREGKGREQNQKESRKAEVEEAGAREGEEKEK